MILYQLFASKPIRAGGRAVDQWNGSRQNRRKSAKNNQRNRSVFYNSAGSTIYIYDNNNYFFSFTNFYCLQLLVFWQFFIYFRFFPLKLDYLWVFFPYNLFQIFWWWVLCKIFQLAAPPTYLPRSITSLQCTYPKSILQYFLQSNCVTFELNDTFVKCMYFQIPSIPAGTVCM